MYLKTPKGGPVDRGLPVFDPDLLRYNAASAWKLSTELTPALYNMLMMIRVDTQYVCVYINKLKVSCPNSPYHPLNHGGAMEEIKRQLFKRLEAVGIGSESVAGLKRDVANCLRVDPDMSLMEVNRRLSYLGWEDGQLDYHTYQLLVAWIEDTTGMGRREEDGASSKAEPPVSEAAA